MAVENIFADVFADVVSSKQMPTVKSYQQT